MTFKTSLYLKSRFFCLIVPSVSPVSRKYINEHCSYTVQSQLTAEEDECLPFLFLLLILQTIARTIRRKAIKPEAAPITGMVKEFLFFLGLQEFSRQRFGLSATLPHRKGVNTN